MFGNTNKTWGRRGRRVGAGWLQTMRQVHWVRPAWAAAGLALAIATLLPGPTMVLAQETQPTTNSTNAPAITVTTDSPFLLLVNGLAAEALTTVVPTDALVCVENPLQYVDQRERWAFRGWSHGITETCVTLTEPGVYRAVYDHEFVIHIRSDVGQIRISRWVVDGTRVEVEVPQTVQDGERARWHFQEWGEGESPFTPVNVLAPLGPMDLEPTWVKEYLIEIEGPDKMELEGSGWYEAGSPLALRAPEVVEGETQGVRLKFSSWQSVGIPVLAIPEDSAASTTISADGPYTLRATYDKEYLVVARSPFGVRLSQWFAESVVQGRRKPGAGGAANPGNGPRPAEACVSAVGRPGGPYFSQD